MADIPYFQTFFGPRVRPDGRMPIEAHRECGHLLRQVIQAVERRRGAHTLALYSCNTLDDWAMREYTHAELGNNTLFGLYCPGPTLDAKACVSRASLIDRIQRVKLILAAHYPKGLALRRIVRDLDGVIKSISNWRAIT